MTRFCRPEILVGAQPIYNTTRFHPNSQTTVDGSRGNASAWLPAGGSYFVLPINERLSIGTAAIGYFGSSLNYAHHWVGRYYLTRIDSEGFSFVPGAAYRITDNLSVGACVNVMYAIERVHSQVNNALDGERDGRLRAIGNHWAAGAVVGVLYELDDCTRFGVTYVSEVKQKFKIKPKFLNVGPQLTEALATFGILNTRLNVLCNVPNWVMASAYTKITPCIAVMGNIGWQQWSNFARVDLSVNNETETTVTVAPSYLDTWHFAIGMEYYMICSKATIGFAYDSSMISNKNRTPSLPLGAQWRFGVGYQYDYSENLKFCCAYELNWMGDLKMFQDRGPLAGTISGKFRNANAQFFNLSFIYDF